MSNHHLISSRGVLVAVALLAGVVTGATGAPMLAQSQGSQQVLETGTHIAVDGTVFSYVKSVDGGKDRLVYEHDGRVYTPKELREHEALHRPPVVSEELLAAATRKPSNEPLELIVWLEDRPGAKIARDVRGLHQPAQEELAQRIQEIHAARLPKGPLTVAEEESLRHFLGGQPLPLSEEEARTVRELSERIEADQATMKREILRRVQAAVAADQGRLRSAVARLGGFVRHVLPMENAAVVHLPAGQLDLLSREDNVVRILESVKGTPDLDQNVETLGVDTGFWAAGRTGGVWDAGVIDTGVQQNHPAFDTIDIISNTGTVDTNGHGTSVAGIIASDDTTNRGLAFGLGTLFVGNATSSSLAMTDADWMVTRSGDDAEGINLSFSYGLANDTDYSSFDQFWDGLADDQQALVAKSAGNSGVGTNNALTIFHPAGYNILMVANMDDQGTVERDDDVITPGSSRGPTLNNRKKPDITAPGTGTQTTNNNWAMFGAPDFTSFGGTSAATPHVTAGIVLVTDLRGLDRPSATKAVLINSADAWTDNGTQADTSDDQEVVGSAWNATYGWGYLDLFEAWLNGLDVIDSTVDDGITPLGLDFKLFRGSLDATEKATLVWNRHVGYNGSNNPSPVEGLTDLDLLAYRESDGSFLDGSFSGRDNVEQISVTSAENVILKVDVFGSIDPDVAVESFSLATEGGFVAVSPPSFTQSFSGFTHILEGISEVMTVTVRNVGGLTARNNKITLTVPPGMNVISGANPRTLPTLAPGASATVSWTVRWDNCPANRTGSLRYATNSLSWGESLSASGSVGLFCEGLF